MGGPVAGDRGRARLVAFAAALLLLVMGWGMAPRAASAQVAVERQVELLPSEGILEMDAELRNRLGLFDDVEGFRWARLFQRSDNAATPWVLELEGRVDGNVVRRREALSGEALEALRAQWSERLRARQDRDEVTTAGPPSTGALDQSGRGRLVLTQTVLALAYHGWAVPVTLDIDSAQGAVATYLLTAGTGFYLPYRLTRDRTVTEAHAVATGWGGSRGIVAGVLAADALTGQDAPGKSRSRSRARLAGGVVGGAAGSVAGMLVADRRAPTEGTARFWGAMGDAGLAGGAALALAAGPWADEEVLVVGDGFEFTETRTRNRPLGSAMVAAGGVAGMGAGLWLGERRSYSEGDVSALRSAMVLGVQSGVTTLRLAGVDGEQGLAAGALVGGLAGTVLGDRRLASTELGTGEGLLVNAGHVAGGATALGLTYLITNEIEGRSRLYLATSTVGSLLGAGLVWRSLGVGSGDATDQMGRAATGHRAVHEPGRGLELRFDPTALLLNGSDPHTMSPVVSLRW